MLRGELKGRRIDNTGILISEIEHYARHLNSTEVDKLYQVISNDEFEWINEGNWVYHGEKNEP